MTSMTERYIPETVRAIERLARTEGADESYGLVTVSNATRWKVPPGWMNVVFVRHLKEINEGLLHHGLSCRYIPPSDDDHEAFDQQGVVVESLTGRSPETPTTNARQEKP